jgi:sulfur-oxidizing protein SoxZ
VTTPQPRVIVPANAAKGEVFRVKTIISHEMETGLRFDDNGAVIPRKIINRFVCTYAGTVVFSVDLHEAVSANPFLEFFLVATETGPLEFIWEEDGGSVFSLSHNLVVT